MHQGSSRRKFLYGAGFVAAGAGAVVAGISSSARAAGSPHWRIGTVTAARTGAVQVDGGAAWLPLEGFPDAWEALVGDQVAVAASATGKGESANPLMHWASVVAAPNELAPGLRLNGANGPRVVDATIIDDGITTQRQQGVRTPTTLRVAIAERATADGITRALAIHQA